MSPDLSLEAALQHLSERTLFRTAIPAQAIGPNVKEHTVITPSRPSTRLFEASRSPPVLAPLRRRAVGGPRRLPIAAPFQFPGAGDSDASDLGTQPMIAKAVAPGATGGEALLPATGAPAPQRIMPVRRRALQSPGGNSPAFMDALTTLLSPAIVTPTLSPRRTATLPLADDMADSPPLPPSSGLMGLGISTTSLSGLGISDITDQLLEVALPVGGAAAGDFADDGNSGSSPGPDAVQNASLSPTDLGAILTPAASQSTMLPNIIGRRFITNGSLRGLRRRRAAPGETPDPNHQSSSQQRPGPSGSPAPSGPPPPPPHSQQSPAPPPPAQTTSSASAPSPYSSPMPYSPSMAAFSPSPLANGWSASNMPADTYYTPPLPGSPMSTFAGSPLLDYSAAMLAASSSYCPPTASATASPILSPIPLSPAMTASPLLSTPRITDSPVFSSPSLKSEESAFEFSKAAAQPTSSGTAFSQNATAASGAANSSLITAQTILSALLAVALFFACLAAWLARRRKPKALPVISSPLPHLEYKYNPGGPDDDVESRLDGQIDAPARSSEVPTLPESVLPSKLWRNSAASGSGGLSEFRKSVEEGLGQMGHEKSLKRGSMAETARAEAGSSFSPDSPVGLRRTPTLPYRPHRCSSLPNTASMPSIPSATYTSHDRGVRGSAEYHEVEVTPPRLRRPAPGSVTRHQQAGPKGSPRPISDPASEYAEEDRYTRPASPTASVKSKGSIKSNKSSIWALRKTAIIASASSSAKKEAKAMDISLPLGRPTRQRIISATPDPAVDISASINMVLLDPVPGQTDTPTGRGKAKARPMSQDAATSRNKLRKRSSSLGAPKARPATIGHTPPAILVTDHPTALVPPPSPTMKRVSTYSLSDTLAYTLSASPSMATTSHYQVRDDSSFINPDMLRDEYAYVVDGRGEHSSQQPYQEATLNPDSNSRPESMQSVTSSLSSTSTANTMDLDTDDEQLRRSQRRRTLLYSVYRQSQSQPDGLSSWTVDSDHTIAAGDHAPPHADTPKRPQNSKTDLVAAFPPVPTAPLTPPYTPVEARFPSSVAEAQAARQQVETPTSTARYRSVSAGAVKPELDPALTRFSRLDLASELAMSQFGSQTSLKSINRDRDGKFIVNSQDPVVGASGPSSPPIPPRSPRRLSSYTPQPAASTHNGKVKPSAPPSTPARRTRSSPVGDKPVSSDGMMTAARIPLPTRSKATRVSVANAVPSSPMVRSIADDLEASILFSSGYEPHKPRPMSTISTNSSAGERRRSSIIDFTYLNPDRTSAGSLTLPRLDEEEDDDRSVYSRDSGSHESAWELAKARVRARASLALPSVMEELA